MWRVHYITITGNYYYRDFENLYALVNTIDSLAIIRIERVAGNGAPPVMEPER